MSKILNRFSDNLICEEALLEIRELAIKNKSNLSDADLSGADLRGADLSDADLSDAKNIENLEWTNCARRDILFILSYSPKSEVIGLKSKNIIFLLKNYIKRIIIFVYI